MFVRANVQPRATVPMADGSSFLPFWEGFGVVDLQVDDDSVQITLESGSQPARCGGCPQVVRTIHEYCQRRIRDLPMLGKAWCCR